MIYNQNVSKVEITLAASGTDAAPITRDLPIFGNVLTKMIFWTTGADTYVSIACVGKRILPISGYIHLPANQVVAIDVEYQVENSLTVLSYNAIAGTPLLTVLAIVGTAQEKDLQLRVLETLERLYRLFEHAILHTAINQPPVVDRDNKRQQTN